MDDIEPIRIRNLDLYVQALTHKSTVREYDIPKGHNERLEFLGDVVLSMIVTKFLYDKYADENEGFLTRIWTKLVRSSSLCKWALQMGLDSLILMSSKALDQGWNQNPKKLEDVFEALIGALFEDQNIAACKRLLYPILEASDFTDVEQDNNYKDCLLRKMQSVHSWVVSQQLNTSQYGQDLLPVYHLVSTAGPDHKKVFMILVSVAGIHLDRGEHIKKRESEQLAAKVALATIERFGVPPIPTRMGYTIKIPESVVRA
jgi:ribonuclease-3